MALVKFFDHLSWFFIFLLDKISPSNDLLGENQKPKVLSKIKISENNLVFMLT